MERRREILVLTRTAADWRSKAILRWIARFFVQGWPFKLGEDVNEGDSKCDESLRYQHTIYLLAFSILVYMVIYVELTATMPTRMRKCKGKTAWSILCYNEIVDSQWWNKYFFNGDSTSKLRHTMKHSYLYIFIEQFKIGSMAGEVRRFLYLSFQNLSKNSGSNPLFD